MIYKTNPPVITGIGVATPLGISKDTFVANLAKGVCGCHPLKRFDAVSTTALAAYQITEPIPNNSPADDPFITFGLHATREAIADARMDARTLHTERIAVVASCSKGGMVSFDRICQATRCCRTTNPLIHPLGSPLLPGGEGRDEGVSISTSPLLPQLFMNLFPGALAARIVHEYGFTTALSHSVVTACATGLHSIIMAANMLAWNDADCAIAGAADASITPLMIAGYERMGAYAHDLVRPFDRDRSGFIIGEGAGMVILEREAAAAKRGAPVYARIRGAMMSQEPSAGIHYQKENDTLAETTRRLLADAGLQPADIDYVSLHATGTQAGDAYEADQCLKIFGRSIDRISFSALKGMLGHMLGASGAVETIATALAIRNKTVYPTINVRQQDPCAAFDLTLNTAKPRDIRYALKFAMGFGGQCGVMLLEK